MKIKVDKSEFEKAIAPIMGAVATRNNTIPAVEGILLRVVGDGEHIEIPDLDYRAFKGKLCPVEQEGIVGCRNADPENGHTVAVEKKC